jgi:hypothetical protein
MRDSSLWRPTSELLREGRLGLSSLVSVFSQPSSAGARNPTSRWAFGLLQIHSASSTPDRPVQEERCWPYKGLPCDPGLALGLPRAGRLVFNRSTSVQPAIQATKKRRKRGVDGSICPALPCLPQSSVLLRFSHCPKSRLSSYCKFFHLPPAAPTPASSCITCLTQHTHTPTHTHTQTLNLPHKDHLLSLSPTAVKYQIALLRSPSSHRRRRSEPCCDGMTRQVPNLSTFICDRPRLQDRYVCAA